MVVIEASTGGTRTGREEAIEAGSSGRLESLYRSYSADALRLGYLLTGDRAIAEDLVQDAFVKVFARFRDLRHPEAFWWYLRRTIVNLSHSRLRRLRVEREYLAREGALPRPDGGSHDLEERDRVLAALRVLRPEQRAAIVLRYYEDLSEEDTAEAMGVAVGTVKSLVHRARERLREELGRKLAEE
jgi:RNA polymerase sigma-70 factor (sigma-E family)